MKKGEKGEISTTIIYIERTYVRWGYLCAKAERGGVNVTLTLIKFPLFLSLSNRT